MSRIFRITRRLLVVLLALIILSAGSVFIVLRYYEDDVIGYVAERIGKNLTTKVTVEKIDLTFWETFPYVSVRFNNVCIQSPKPFEKTDTLLRARSIFLSFNARDLFAGRYNIRQIKVTDAMIHPIIGKKGEKNWEIWITQDTTQSESLHLDIRTIKFRDTGIRMENRQALMSADLSLRKGDCEFELDNGNWMATLGLSGNIHHITKGENTLLANREFSLKSSISQEKDIFTVRDGELDVDDLPLRFDGEFVNGKSPAIRAKIEGTHVRLSDVLSLLRAETKEKLDAYSPDGDADVVINIMGEINEGKTPKTLAHIILTNTNIDHSKSGTKLDNISLEASYEAGGKSDLLRIKSASANFGAGVITLSGSIANLSRPSLDLEADASADLADLKSFLQWDTLSVCAGQINARAHISGEIHGYGAEQNHWQHLLVNGSLNLDEGQFQVSGSDRSFTQTTARLELQGKNARIHQLSGLVNGSDYALKGEMNNLLPYLLGNEGNLTMNGNLYSKLIDFNQLLSKSVESQSDYALSIPPNLSLNLNARVDQFTLGAFEAHDISGVIHLENGSVRADPVSFRSVDGNVLARVELSPADNATMLLQCTASLNDINIQKLFSAFDNFNQEFITAANLRGKASADVVFSAPVKPDLSMISSGIYSLIDIRIENGEIIRLNALENLADYIKKNKWVAPFVNEEKFRERMSHIRFSTLQNTIRIENEQINIPQMEIRSSAMDISARGTHTFDRKIDYSVGFNLRDILIRKEKEWEEEDDGLGKQLFVYMKGSSDNPEFGIDKEASKSKRKQDVLDEKKNVQALLRQEIGLFRKKDGLEPYKEKDNKPGSSTTIEWSEFDSPQPTTKSVETSTPPQSEGSTEPAKKTQKKIPKWMQEKEEFEKDPPEP